MASILVNDNTQKNTDVINAFIEPKIFMNIVVRNIRELKRSASEIDIDARYDFRPDRLAYDLYNEDFWYPAILAVNGMGSMLQFQAETLNYKVKVPSLEAVQKMTLDHVKQGTINDVVDIIFKDV